VIAILNSVISLYYYLLLVKSAYYANEVEPQTPIVSGLMPRVAAYVLSATIVLLGIFPRPLMDYLASLNLPVTMLP
jgi:NADH-quinone oxidoreductase subunit N